MPAVFPFNLLLPGYLSQAYSFPFFPTGIRIASLLVLKRTIMRTLIKLTFFAATALLGFTACTKDSNTAPQPTVITGNITPSLTDGVSWRVGFFSNNGVDQTNTYQEYKLTFSQTGNLTAANNFTTYSGTWNSTSTEPLTLTIDFSNQGAFDELSHEWRVLQQGDTQIRLSNISNHKSEADHLTLNKNLIK